jgi:hypothetical protein
MNAKPLPGTTPSIIAACIAAAVRSATSCLVVISTWSRRQSQRGRPAQQFADPL